MGSQKRTYSMTQYPAKLWGKVFESPQVKPKEFEETKPKDVYEAGLLSWHNQVVLPFMANYRAFYALMSRERDVMTENYRVGVWKDVQDSERYCERRMDQIMSQPGIRDMYAPFDRKLPINYSDPIVLMTHIVSHRLMNYRARNENALNLYAFRLVDWAGEGKAEGEPPDFPVVAPKEMMDYLVNRGTRGSLDPMVSSSVVKGWESFLRDHVAKGDKVSISAPHNVRFYADKAVLREVASELSLNAIKHTPEGERELGIYLEVGRKRVRLVVSDNGGGIPKKDLKRIFEPHYTTKPRKSVDVGGDKVEKGGQGLTLAYHLVERTLPNGVIIVETASEDEKGIGYRFNPHKGKVVKLDLGSGKGRKPSPASFKSASHGANFIVTWDYIDLNHLLEKK